MYLNKIGKNENKYFLIWYIGVPYVLLEEVVLGHADGQADDEDDDYADHHNLPWTKTTFS